MAEYNAANEYAIFQQARAWMVIHNQKVLNSQKAGYPSNDFIDIDKAIRIVKGAIKPKEASSK